MDRRRLQSAAADYPYLRGLITIPLGLLFVLSALGNWHWGPLRHTWVFVAAVLVIAMACALITRYYSQHYGRVTPSATQQLKVTAAGAVGAALMIGGTTLLRSRASWSLDLPVNAIAAAFGLLMVVYYTVVVGLRAHHLLIWGSLVVAGLLPVWTGADPSNIGLVLAGVAVIVNGVFDHRLLMRTFAPPVTTTLGPRNAGR